LTGAKYGVCLPDTRPATAKGSGVFRMRPLRGIEIERGRPKTVPLRPAGVRGVPATRFNEASFGDDRRVLPETAPGSVASVRNADCADQYCRV